jgi:hypothetical protein
VWRCGAGRRLDQPDPVYDKAAGHIRLYLDGTLVADAAHAVPSPSTGSFAIGRSTIAGAPAELLSGEVYGVRVWQRVVPASELVDYYRPVKLGQWRFSAVCCDVIRDEGGFFKDLTIGGPGVSFTVEGHEGGAIVLDGTTNVFSELPVMRTDQTFSLSVWVKPTDLSGTRVVASQDGVNQPGFSLEYSSTLDRWILVTTVQDSSGPVTRQFAQSAAAPVLDQWTHLVAVYDAQAQQLRLTVDGVAGIPADNVSNWNAAGPFRLGAIGDTGSFVGTIDEAFAWDTVVND